MKLLDLMQVYHTEFYQNWYSTLDAEVNLTHLLGGDGGEEILTAASTKITVL
jgi:hypothetical protein